MATSEQNKQTVARVFDAFRAGDVDAFDDLIVEDYVQHNPQADNGLQAVKDFFAPIGPVDVEVHRVIAADDVVAVHSHYKTFNMAVVDIFRLNDDGKIIEHWDVLQPIPETTASGNDMFSQLSWTFRRQLNPPRGRDQQPGHRPVLLEDDAPACRCSAGVRAMEPS